MKLGPGAYKNMNKQFVKNNPFKKNKIIIIILIVDLSGRYTVKQIDVPALHPISPIVVVSKLFSKQR